MVAVGAALPGAEDRETDGLSELGSWGGQVEGKIPEGEDRVYL